MRGKLCGFVVSVLMVMAIGGLTAPPSFATDYFVKYLYQTTTPGAPNCVGQSSGDRHGTVVFRRTASTMSATVALRGAAPETQYVAHLIFKPRAGACDVPPKVGTALFNTDSKGNGSAHLGPASQSGVAFWNVDVAKNPTISGQPYYATPSVPAHGF